MTLNDILREPLVPAPNNPVTLIGAVIVFCDLETTLSIPLMDGRWKVAVGLHPKSFNHDDAYLDQVRTLVQSNPLVAALGEIGLDRTVPDYLWDEQERTFPTISSLLPPRDSLSSSPERVFKGTFIIRPYNISVKHAPGTRGYIYIVSMVDTLVLKNG